MKWFHHHYCREWGARGETLHRRDTENVFRGVGYGKKFPKTLAKRWHIMATAYAI